MADKKVKLTPEQVKQYEEMSGFKTTGDVTITFSDDKVYEEYIKLLEATQL